MKNAKNKDPKLEQAKDLVDSVRGHFILSQALYMAIDSMNRRPIEGTGDGQLEREPSNLIDMKLLYTQLLNTYSPQPMMPVIGGSMEELKSSHEVVKKQLSDTLEGTYCKPHYLIDELMAEAIENKILSLNEKDKNHWKNYIYLETDRNGLDYFRHKDGSLVKNLISKENDQPDNVINLNDARKSKHD